LIPYVNPHSLKVGPIEPFGIFVALGIFLAARIVVKQSAKQGLDPNPIHDYAPWGVGAGVVAGHLVHLFFYHPEELSKSTFQILKVWDGRDHLLPHQGRELRQIRRCLRAGRRTRMGRGTHRVLRRA
jgi:prolipoprotein diacylglyceryltransferase